MNRELRRLAKTLSLDDDRHQWLRLAFGIACADRVRDLLVDQKAIAALDVGLAFVRGGCDKQALAEAAKAAAAIASSHPGSPSIDGAGHAAVSATHTVAEALAGQALVAADYAAYAAVYNYGGYAVNDPSAFDEEYAWQIKKFEELSRLETDEHGAASPLK